MQTIKTRFAPSNTGILHIGSARTALFNYLYAKQNNGCFSLRIEDTDHSREYENAFNLIKEDLNWLGLQFDEIVVQSHNKQRHIDIAHQLLNQGSAYKSYNDDGTYAIKFQVKHDLTLHDAVLGKISYKADKVEDFVIVRSNGNPTFLLSCTVDDHDMKITHIIRGADHVSNMFKQNAILQALNWPSPQYVHLPLIANEEANNKLSKRYGNIGIKQFKEQGFLPEAMINYMLRLGWSHGNDEIISIEQAVQWFSFKNIQKSTARFSMQKLQYLNKLYISKSSGLKLAKLCSLDTKFIPIIDIYKSRFISLVDMRNALSKITQESPLEHVLLCNDLSMLQCLSQLDVSLYRNPKNLELYIKDMISTYSIEFKAVMQCLRWAILDQESSPNILLIMSVLPIGIVRKRIESFITKSYEKLDAHK